MKKVITLIVVSALSAPVLSMQERNAEITSLPVERNNPSSLQQVLKSESEIRTLQGKIRAAIETANELVSSTEAFAKVVSENQSLCEAILAKPADSVVQEANQQTCIEEVAKLKQRFMQAALALDSAMVIVDKFEQLLPHLDNSIAMLRARQSSEESNSKTLATCRRLTQLSRELTLVFSESEKQNLKTLEQCGV